MHKIVFILYARETFKRELEKRKNFRALLGVIQKVRLKFIVFVKNNSTNFGLYEIRDFRFASYGSISDSPWKKHKVIDTRYTT